MKHYKEYSDLTYLNVFLMSQNISSEMITYMTLAMLVQSVLVGAVQLSNIDHTYILKRIDSLCIS